MIPVKDLATRFTYHPPTDDQIDTYKVIRDEAFKLAVLINNRCPDGREKALAITNLEEVVMWANAAIARYES